MYILINLYVPLSRYIIVQNYIKVVFS